METDRDAAERERRQERQLSLLYLLAILLSCLLAAVVLLDSPKYGPTELPCLPPLPMGSGTFWMLR